MHDKTLVSFDEKSKQGIKQSKECLTIMPCVNATGTHKLPLMIIGKSVNPRCFKIKTLPTMYYKSSRKAWQSQGLFNQWFFDCFGPGVSKHLASTNLVQKTILLLDNAACHGSEDVLRTDYENFTVHYFSPRMTAIFRPLDQNIIKNVKQKYR